MHNATHMGKGPAEEMKKTPARPDHSSPDGENRSRSCIHLHDKTETPVLQVSGASVWEINVSS